MKKLYFLIILLFCSSVHAAEVDNPAQLRRMNVIQAGEIQTLNKKNRLLSKKWRSKLQS
ncbi:MAG: hypothetical protein LN568_06080 [Rickettsia endosymbiont of Pseudomimeciton antennatum]|nr:hypothetical protein [Rickettsia endosymbiont of Pseudomimeciton antennatum]